ncbi:hypothetical protein ACFL7D_09250 [candidate division KSB1 bacterium]
MFGFTKKLISSLVPVTIFILIFTGLGVSQTADNMYFKDLRWRNIGPASMSGRVTDIEALDNDFKTVYAAAASGGVWKSVNAGNTWEPIFEKYGVASMGDIDIAPSDPDIIWVGTGEANNRNSVAWGNGIYKSVDGGETFVHLGLEETHQIARIRIHPENPDIVYVAAIGHLWGWSGDRGVFKTTDGGKTWTKLINGLPNDGKHGANDLVMDMNNPNTLYVNMYKRIRTAFGYDGGSTEGGIFKTTDGGRSWKKLTKGLPAGQTGRIGLDIYSKDPRILVALVEAEQSPESRLDEWSTMRGATHQSLDTPYSGVYRSENGGDSWEYLNTFNNRPFYFSQIRINPSDEQIVYVLAQSLQISMDGGKTLRNIGGVAHPDFHAMWIDPNKKDRFYIGNDGGVFISHDQGENYLMFDNVPVSQFYAISVDMREPYWIYGGLQDNNSWGGPSNSRDAQGILNDHWFNINGGDGFHTQVDPSDWRIVYCESQGGRISRINVETRVRQSISPNRNNTINWEDHLKMQTNGREGFRFNWSSPIVLSPHNPKTVLFGGNHLFRSVDRGDTWEIISPDVSTNDVNRMQPSGGMTPDNTAAEVHCTIITISESSIRPGIIWVGTDDGNVQVTRNSGMTWENVSGNIFGVPSGLWVSRVAASNFDLGTAYVTIDGHRSDNFQPWVFKTTDFGRTWENIGAGLPADHPVYIIKEDIKNPDLLFAGTEFEVFASVDGGNNWFSILNNMPNVAFHDLVIHPRDGDLIAATHGRAVWIMDDITALQQLTPDVKHSEAYLFDSRPAVVWQRVSRGAASYRGDFHYGGENPRTAANVHFFIGSEPSGDVILEISQMNSELKHTTAVDVSVGVNRYEWNFRFDPPQVSAEQRGQMQQMSQRGGRGFGGRGASAGPGTYLVKLTVNGKTYTNTLVVRSDPLLEGKN